LPLQRAIRGEVVGGQELDIRFDDGTSITIIAHAAPIRDDSGTIQGAVGAAIDISERKRQQQHRELLLNELNHRVKNTLATVQSLAMQTLRNASNVKEGRQAFEARLIALSKAHDVLTREQWEGVGLREIVAEALAAYIGSSQEARLLYQGPEIRLQPKAGLALSMALHELATNAAKYGALSSGAGRVDINWRLDQNEPRGFRLKWSESGGPPVIAPSKRGFGSRLIEQGLSQDLSGTVLLEFAPEGVICTIDAPFDQISRGALRSVSLEGSIGD
jgi:two-component sensor histidine kinase